jgi:hypothetical protein
MRDLVVIISLASVGAALIALSIAGWHTCRIEWLRHQAKDQEPG